MNQPKRLIVEYDDGCTKEADFGKLDAPVAAPAGADRTLSPAGSRGGAKHYLLVRWQDGWQESSESKPTRPTCSATS